VEGSGLSMKNGKHSITESDVKKHGRLRSRTGARDFAPEGNPLLVSVGEKKRTKRGI